VIDLYAELEEMVSNRNLMNSYKPYFLMALIVNVSTNEKKEFSLYEMACLMCAYSFCDVCKLGRRIRYLDKLYDVAVIAIEKEDLMESSTSVEVFDALFDSTNIELRRMVLSLCNYVPYRLLAYIWSHELSGKTDREKNQIIEELSQAEERCIYSNFHHYNLVSV